jgi:hypothetical protein
MRLRLSSMLFAAVVLLIAQYGRPVSAGISSIAQTTAADEVQYATMARQAAAASASSAAAANNAPAAPNSAAAGQSAARVQFSNSVILFDVGDISATVRQNGRVANW